MNTHPLDGSRPASATVLALDSASAGRGRGPAEPETAASQAGPPVTSVGQLAGLRPRRRARDGGEAPGADVDLVDALDAPVWRTVADWLADAPSPAGRRTRLRVLAAFLRWLHSLRPAVELLAVTEDHLDSYRDAAASGTLAVGVRTPGKPLGNSTVAKRSATLWSFYTYARLRGAPRPGPAAGAEPAESRRAGVNRPLTREERRLLREGVAQLAGDGRLTAAAAVALLEGTGAPMGTLAGLTTRGFRTVAEADGTEHSVITYRNHGGDIVAVPVPWPARRLLEVLRRSRPAGELLITKDDGQPADPEWIGAALTDAALAGGIPRERAELLHPHMLCATTIGELLTGWCFPEPSR
ncbi:hypothetical protein [Nonomuraea sp. NPDC048916]|uniref:hypothetical protein n=1 Tax=Nonomuraea sp. NPDC048916 TaxID=3154232 RepID=UPI0033FD1970